MNRQAMLRQEDVDALVAALSAVEEGTQGGGDRRFHEARSYDFARPGHLPTDFARALTAINMNFARALSGMLTGYLSAAIQVDPLSVDQVTFRQFCHSVPEMTAIGTFGLPPLDGMALFEIDPYVAWAFMERSLGGQGDQVEPGKVREFTLLDRGLLDDLFRRILRELAKCWEILVPMKPALREVVTNAPAARITPPDDRVVVCSFGITLQGATGMAHYCIPENSLDFERLLNAEYSWETDHEEVTAERDRERLLRNLTDTSLVVRACLPEIEIPLGELASLQEGDVISFTAHADEPILVYMGQEPLLLARPITVDEQVAVEIVDEIEEGTDG